MSVSNIQRKLLKMNLYKMRLRRVSCLLAQVYMFLQWRCGQKMLIKKKTCIGVF